MRTAEVCLRHGLSRAEFWTCPVLVPPYVLVYATFPSKATRLFQPGAECLRPGL
jgi:hypothetical protein